MRKQRRTLRKRSSKKKSREGLCGQGSYFWGRTYAKGAIYRGQNGDTPSGHPDGEEIVADSMEPRRNNTLQKDFHENWIPRICMPYGRQCDC
ncbi:hypothetical protein CEXT_427521 [Caerostris extrusa]|uniref:Uncharacterized protein n=1 Tax=Caerostris extrusa TaxID=172846 RepID=A0AAV4PWG9_CAEEX|nr:hypothetical protein CEXT_427521 [Caerostris extrusa]